MIILSEAFLNVNPTTTAGKVAKIGLGMGTIGALSLGMKSAVNSLENPQIPPHSSISAQPSQSEQEN